MRSTLQVSTVIGVLVGLAAPVPAAGAAPASREREISLGAGPAPEREISLGNALPGDATGLPREVAGLRISGFVVGSLSYNSDIQLVPEFAGGAQALADAESTNFRFDKVGIALSKRFAPWLSAGAAIEVESHRDRHSHGFDPAFGCPGAGACVERFGAEAPETEAVLDRFNVTAVAPLGTGLSLSLGRVDVPFGIERHDEPLNLTATTSEVFQFARPQRMTGLQAAYQFGPSLDLTTWVVNRWESETTHDPFDDANKDKSAGGRIGLTPFARQGLLNIGLGGFWGPEGATNGDKRWVLDLDATWTPIDRLLLAAEAVYGGEDRVSFRERGTPFPAPAVVEQNVNWWGGYLLLHYDVRDWFGLSVRYGYLDDQDGSRTGVDQRLESGTVTPIIHLSRLIRDLRPTGATYTRTRHPINWVDLKLEYRINHSNREVFSDARPGTDILSASRTSHQVQAQVVVNF